MLYVIGSFFAQLSSMENTESKRLNHGNPELLEKQRIEAIRNRSYQERLEQLFALIELSHDIRMAHEKQKNEPRDSQRLV